MIQGLLFNAILRKLLVIYKLQGEICYLVLGFDPLSKYFDFLLESAIFLLDKLQLLFELLAAPSERFLSLSIHFQAGFKFIDLKNLRLRRQCFTYPSFFLLVKFDVRFELKSSHIIPRGLQLKDLILQLFLGVEKLVSLPLFAI